MPELQPKPLQGKTALVTGAARRLGRASALALAHAGADVAITFRNSAREALPSRRAAPVTSAVFPCKGLG